MPQPFTLKQANALLPEIRPLVRKILALRAEILSMQPDVWPVVEKAAGNGGRKAASEIVRQFDEVDQAVRQIQSRGILIKDINTGLVDFPSNRDGREVYLCWKYDEPEIRYWHEINDGFAGRQPL
jgi:hypothetical protein